MDLKDALEVDLKNAIVVDLKKGAITADLKKGALAAELMKAVVAVREAEEADFRKEAISNTSSQVYKNAVAIEEILKDAAGIKTRPVNLMANLKSLKADNSQAKQVDEVVVELNVEASEEAQLLQEMINTRMVGKTKIILADKLKDIIKTFSQTKKSLVNGTIGVPMMVQYAPEEAEALLEAATTKIASETRKDTEIKVQVTSTTNGLENIPRDENEAGANLISEAGTISMKRHQKL